MGIETIGGQPVLFAEPDHLLSTEQDAVDLIGETYGGMADTIAVRVSDFEPTCFDLSTKQLGLFIQKFVQYQIRLVIIGELSTQTQNSKPLRDFIYEANNGSQTWFVEDENALRNRLITGR